MTTQTMSQFSKPTTPTETQTTPLDWGKLHQKQIELIAMTISHNTVFFSLLQNNKTNITHIVCVEVKRQESLRAKQPSNDHGVASSFGLFHIQEEAEE